MIKTGQVRVHRQDISHLSSHAINFKSGSSVSADALITATGFSAKPTLKFLPEDTHSDLGIPSTNYTSAQHQQWQALNEQADLKIGESFPRLLAGPFRGPTSNIPQPFHPGMDAETSYTPFRLYRAVAPPGLTKAGDHSLAFVSMFSNLANTPRCELQCLWAYAYLNNSLAINPDPNTVFEESALLAQYARHRAPYGHGRFFPDLVFDQLPYMDSLLQDLGLRYWRKSNLFMEMFSPYLAKDYRGLVREWIAIRGSVAGDKKVRSQRVRKDVSDVESVPLLNGKV
jgi:hypothetical protein